jgi:NAD(P)-dependent dehydrogenase (short-subunit alcohol dehydrogenase family)
VGTFLVTGASTGIGRATALRLDRGGHRVVASVRREEDAAALGDAASDRLEHVILDVTDEASIAAAGDRVASLTDRLDGLVNNAGAAFAGPLELLPVDQFRAQIEVNLIGQVAVTQAFLPALRRARGRVVFVSSIGGRIALPFNGPYSASKFGIEAIGDSLRQEVRAFGMEVVLVEPGAVATPIWDRGAERADRILEGVDPEKVALYEERLDAFRAIAADTGARGVDPDEVAQVIETALLTEKPRTRYIVGRDAKMRARVRRLVSDRTFDRMVARQLDKGAG